MLLVGRGVERELVLGVESAGLGSGGLRAGGLLSCLGETFKKAATFRGIDPGERSAGAELAREDRALGEVKQ